MFFKFFFPYEICFSILFERYEQCFSKKKKKGKHVIIFEYDLITQSDK